MKNIHNLFFDEESSIGDMVWFYGCCIGMLLMGISTLYTCSPQLLPALFFGVAIICVVVWIWAREGGK